MNRFMPAARAAVVLVTVVVAGGCAVNSRGLGFAHASAGGSRSGKEIVYNEVVVDPARAEVSVLLPDGKLVAASEITVERITALNGATDAQTWALKVNGDWVVTWPDRGGFWRRTFSMPDGLRGYAMQFDQGRLVSLSVRLNRGERPDTSEWSPGLAKAGTVYRLPLSEADLTALFGPIQSRMDHWWY